MAIDTHDGGPYHRDALESRPPWRWPNGSRLAVWVIPNIEVFDSAFPISGGGPVPDTRGLAAREYGNRVGVGRIRRVLAEYDIKATAAVNAGVADRYPDLLAAVTADGWETIGHGDVNNRTLLDYEPGQEASVIESCLARLESVTGQRPRGWLSPGLHETDETLSHLLAAGVHYVADWIIDDQPTILDVAGTRTITSLPYTLEVNDKAAYDRRLLTPDQFADLAKRQFDYLYEESEQTALVFALALHPFLSGLPHRMRALESILSHIRMHEGVWSATGSEIVDAFHEAWQVASDE
jgi:allantoinase